MSSEPISQDAWQPEAPADGEVGLNADRESAAAIEPEPTPDDDYDMYSDGDEYGYGYRYCPGPDYCENHELYQPGGLHPVQIQDCIEDRYLIIHKLGFGGSSTVWLARDNIKERYVALKFVTAKMSGCAEAEAAIYRTLHDSLPEDVREDFLLPLYDTFWINGPNGKHFCLSMGISGPSLASFHQGRRMKIRPDLVNVVAAQVVEGLFHLHDAGLVYGDLSAGNIAFTLPRLDHFSVRDLYSIFGEPERFEVQVNYEEDYEWGEIHAPAFVYPPLDFTGELPVGLLRPEVKFIDFGASHLLGSKRGRPGFGYTMSYADPPCLYFGEEPTQESDKWALACILFELRSAVELFPQNGDGVWSEIVARMGPIPKSWEEEEEAPDDHAGDNHAKDDDGMVADVNGENSKDGKDAKAGKVEENDQSLAHINSAESGDNGSADQMKLTEDTVAESVAQREDSTVQSAWKFLPKKLNELIRRHLIRRAQSLLVRLGVDSWKQYCVNLLGSVSFRLQSTPGAPEDALDDKNPESEHAPSSPDPSLCESLPVAPFFPEFFKWRGDDPTLHGQIANIGTHHPWHSLTIEERRERLERYNEQLSERNREVTSDEALDRGPPPPDKLSSEEAADLEDLLIRLLTWEREDRPSLKDICEHPWLVKAYAPCSSEPWLQRFYRGASYYGFDKQYI